MGANVSSQRDQGVMKSSMAETPASNRSVRPPLIPTEDGQQERQEETLFSSLAKLFASTTSSLMEIVGGIVPGFRKHPSASYRYQNQQQRYSAGWPVQDSYVIADDDEPPTIEARTPTPKKKTYAFMSNDAEKMQRWQQGRSFYTGHNGETNQQTPSQHPHQQQPNQHSRQQQSKPKQGKFHQHQSTTHVAPYTYYEKNHEETNEIVFGAVQENDARREASVIKPVDYGDPMFNQYSIRARPSSAGSRDAY